ncbi:MAG TPA: DUF6089 family protein [Cyclobacteriaceae bacterium]|jgi:hypothetical protein|nr:DUF6089 family protein [Cyclobacteriaceae bacterium]
MKMKIPFVLLVSILGSGIAMDSFSQKLSVGAIKRNNKRIATYRGRKDVFKKYSGVGFSVNALNYFGDLSPLPNKFSTDISFTRPGFGISFFRCYGPRYTLSAQFMYGTLTGSDANSAHLSDIGNGVFRHERNLSFRNRIKELTVMAVFDLFENPGTNYMNRVNWTPYAFVGIEAFVHNPQAHAPQTFLDGSPNPKAGQWVDLQPLGTEGQYSNLQTGDVNYGIKPYSLLQVAVPFGIGARIKLSDFLDLWADIGFRYSFTDYLDDVSRNYVDLGAIKDPLARALSYRSNELADISKYSTSSYIGRDGKMYMTIDGYGREYKTNNRGNFRNNDIYMVTSIKITRVLGSKFHRAKFR